jgi:PPP family 3-phenylpropionic acid transporter
MRLWGSLSFIVASICGGWVLEPLGAGAAIWLMVGGVVLTIAAAHGLQRPTGLGRLKAATSPPRLRVADALGLLRSRVFLIFLLATGLVQGSHGMFYTFGVLHWREQGLDTAWAGTLWGVAIVCEIALFAYSAAVLRRAKPVQLIVLGCAAAVVRWLVMGFDPPLALLVLLQVSHSLTYTASHIGAIHFMSGVVADRQSGTAQALYASVTGGIGLGAAMLIAGPLYASYGGRGYWAMAVMAAMALVAALALQRSAHPHSAACGGETSAPS